MHRLPCHKGRGHSAKFDFSEAACYMLIAKNTSVSEPLLFTAGYISLPSSSRLTSHLYGYLGVAVVVTFNVMIESQRRAQISNIWDTSLEKEEKKTEKEQSS